MRRRYLCGRISSLGLLFLLVLATLSWLDPVYADTPESATETGIKGRVVMAPAHPGPAIEGQSNEAPFRGSFQVLDVNDTSVTQFESDENGHFAVVLPPGKYTIVPDASVPNPIMRRQRRTVTVPEDGFAEVVLKFDTGMR